MGHAYDVMQWSCEKTLHRYGNMFKIHYVKMKSEFMLTFYVNKVEVRVNNHICLGIDSLESYIKH